MVPCRSRWSGETLRSTPTLGASDGVSSIWNEDISMTWMRSLAGGSRSRMAVPMLPPICASLPAAWRIWAMSAVVVDLPLVPVMATNGASGQLLARSRQNSSMSPTISTPGGLGLGHRPVRLGMGQRHAGRQHQGGKPAPVGASEVLDAESRLPRRRPGSRPCRRPQRRWRRPPQAPAPPPAPTAPRPNTATVLPANVVTGVIPDSLA